MRRTALAILGAGLAAAALPGAGLADDPALALGRYLAQECASCHSAQGAQKGIPAIAGRDVSSLIALLQLYRKGARTNPAMVSVAQSLDDEQIEAVARYLASLSPRN